MISNRDQLETSAERELALDCIEAAIDAAAPENAARSGIDREGDSLHIGGTPYDLDAYETVLVVGGGKAAGGVTRVLESILGDRITDGFVVTKQPTETEHVRTAVGDHPLPSDRNVTATAELLELVRAAGEETLILFVLTGGASALLTAPAGELTRADLHETTELLLEGGVPIGEINAVRKHLSASKGGQIVREATPATVVGLLLSDVVGNDLSTIGSGPTVPDDTTYADALAVFDQHDLDPPQTVLTHLESGGNGALPETPFHDDPAFEHAQNTLLGDNTVALDAARDVAATAGYEPLILTSRLRGEASEAAKPLVAIAEEAVVMETPVEPPAVLLAGGETTVSIAGDGGSGGPNQEFALSSALEQADGVTVAAVDSDGEDGDSDAAGAITDGTTVDGEVERAQAHLDSNDAGTYLSEIGATIETGPTGTNVNDVVVLVAAESEA
ncbi:glycerate kinase type-2 family protein [Salinarchaeum laminariae]|uniref:glycerate kinase type-2 family protein n=1 Tax=Salinarchaeum laminariae TaxID=869888 RepID=UPI0020BF1104|nr:DUF4147 domain-containing protein [Salinarchaeum laminariae]